jgi:ferredoxin
MRVTVDRSLCQGHNRCYSWAPEVFDVDDEGLSSARDDWDRSNDDVLRRLHAAVANCPERAITIEE